MRFNLGRNFISLSLLQAGFQIGIGIFALTSTAQAVDMDCLLKRNSTDSYYIMQNGTKLTGNYSNLDSVLGKLKELRSSDVCSPLPVGASAANRSCIFKKEDSSSEQYYIELNGNRITPNYTNSTSAIDQMKKLIDGGACTPMVASGCKIEKSGSSVDSWFIGLNGQKISSNYTNMSSAKEKLKFFKDSKVCRQSPQGFCKFKRKSGVDRWYVEQDGQLLFGTSSSMDSMIGHYETFLKDQVCLAPPEDRCEIVPNVSSSGPNRFKIKVANEYIDNRHYSLDEAVEKIASYTSKGICFAPNPAHCKLDYDNQNSRWKILVNDGPFFIGLSYTNYDSAKSKMDEVKSKNLCFDDRFESKCLIRKVADENRWFVEKDGKQFGPRFSNFESVETNYKKYVTDKFCNAEKQLGCRLVKKQNQNKWFIKQDDEQMSKTFYSLESASEEYQRFNQQGLCKRGPCDIRQRPSGKIAIYRDMQSNPNPNDPSTWQFPLQTNDDLNSVTATIQNLLQQNTCTLPSVVTDCRIRHYGGIYYLVNANDQVISQSQDYQNLLQGREQLVSIGYCGTLDPNLILIPSAPQGGNVSDGGRAPLYYDSGVPFENYFYQVNQSVEH